MNVVFDKFNRDHLAKRKSNSVENLTILLEFKGTRHNQSRLAHIQGGAGGSQSLQFFRNYLSKLKIFLPINVNILKTTSCQKLDFGPDSIPLIEINSREAMKILLVTS